MKWVTTYADRYIRPLYEDMKNTEHVLIAGATGCGKSNLIDNFMCYMLEESLPTETQFILCDPKMVALTKYRNLPHVIRYCSNKQDIINILSSAVKMMESRYAEMQAKEVTDYEGSSIYIVIDELGDLMTTSKAKVMLNLQRLLQLGRAAKIHVICATQSPKRQIIPGELVCNFTLAIAMRCKSSIESRQIIDVKGAEKLPKHGVVLVNCGTEIKPANVEKLNEDHLKEVIADWLHQGNENGFFIRRAESELSARKEEEVKEYDHWAEINKDINNSNVLEGIKILFSLIPFAVILMLFAMLF